MKQAIRPGSFFVFGLLDLDVHLSWVLDQGVSGILLFSNLVIDEQSLDSAVKAIFDLSHKKGLKNTPALIVDQEGGVVRRIKDEVLDFPSSYAIGSIGSLNKARMVGRLTGEYLRRKGLDWNLAPCADVVTAIEDQCIATRSFGDDFRLVSLYAHAFYQGQRKAGIISTAKHFPGHGFVSEDSHAQLPVVNTHLSKDKFLDSFLKPFSFLIKKDIETIMPAHVVYPFLDPDNPATFSMLIIKELLRDKLGYNGVVISDDLTMQGALVRYASDIGRASIDAFNVGCDLLCVGLDESMQQRSLANFSMELEDGNISPSRIEYSLRKISTLNDIIYKLRKKCRFKTCQSWFVRKTKNYPKKMAREVVKISDGHNVLPYKICDSKPFYVYETQGSPLFINILISEGLCPEPIDIYDLQEEVPMPQDDEAALIRLGVPIFLNKLKMFVDHMSKIKARWCILSTGLMKDPPGELKEIPFVFTGSLTPLVLKEALHKIFTW